MNVQLRPDPDSIIMKSPPCTKATEVIDVVGHKKQKLCTIPDLFEEVKDFHGEINYDMFISMPKNSPLFKKTALTKS